MNIAKIRRLASPGDIILIRGNNLLSYLIRYAQKVQTLDGKPSLWNHCMIYIANNTVAESTIDFKPYTRGMDNGVQYNYLDNHADAHRAMLLHFPWSDLMREMILEQVGKFIRQGLTYPISGLLGSLLSFWIFPWASNPLQSKHSLYCSAFMQECYIPTGIDFDPKHTSRNTSPEMISQYKMIGLEKIDCSEGV